MRGVLLKLVVVLGAVLVALVVAEQVLRWIGWEYKPLTIQVRDRQDARGFHLFDDEHFVYDPRLLWRPRPGFGVFNAQGFRGEELPRTPAPGEIRILAVGDSNTLGWAGEDGANWPADLDEELSAGRANLEVINAGVWGYSSAQGLARLEESLSFRPALVLISFGSNDAHRVSRSDREFAAGSQWLRRLTRWLTKHRLGQLVAVSFQREASDEPLVPRVPLEKYRQNLERMATMVRSAGAEPVFLTRPFTGTINDPLVWKNYAFDYNAVTVETAERNFAMVVDLYSYFKGRPEFFTDESHFTADGHLRAAKIVADHLRPFVDEAEAREPAS